MPTKPIILLDDPDTLVPAETALLEALAQHKPIACGVCDGKVMLTPRLDEMKDGKMAVPAVVWECEIVSNHDGKSHYRRAMPLRFVVSAEGEGSERITASLGAGIEVKL